MTQNYLSLVSKQNFQVLMNRGQQRDDDVTKPLMVKRTLLCREEYEIYHARFIHWMRVVEFLGIFQISYMCIDGALITTLIETGSQKHIHFTCQRER